MLHTPKSEIKTCTYRTVSHAIEGHLQLRVPEVNWHLSTRLTVVCVGLEVFPSYKLTSTPVKRRLTTLTTILVTERLCLDTAVLGDK